MASSFDQFVTIKGFTEPVAQCCDLHDMLPPLAIGELLLWAALVMIELFFLLVTGLRIDASSY